MLIGVALSMPEIVTTRDVTLEPGAAPVTEVKLKTSGVASGINTMGALLADWLLELLAVLLSGALFTEKLELILLRSLLCVAELTELIAGKLLTGLLTITLLGILLSTLAILLTAVVTLVLALLVEPPPLLPLPPPQLDKAIKTKNTQTGKTLFLQKKSIKTSLNKFSREMRR